MTNETPVNDNVDKKSLAQKIKNLPWKHIAIGTAAALAGAAVVKFSQSLDNDQTLEVTSVDYLADGSAIVTAEPVKN